MNAYMPMNMPNECAHVHERARAGIQSTWMGPSALSCGGVVISKVQGSQEEQQQGVVSVRHVCMCAQLQVVLSVRLHCPALSSLGHNMLPVAVLLRCVVAEHQSQVPWSSSKP